MASAEETGVDFDVAVVGGGVVGSAAAYHLARAAKALSVVMLEQGPLGGHSMASSHGGSRITRRTDANALLARMATRGLKEWDELEGRLGERLLRRCGNLDIGNPSQQSFQRVRATLFLTCMLSFSPSVETNR
jgi:sarcosine oxidase